MKHHPVHNIYICTPAAVAALFVYISSLRSQILKTFQEFSSDLRVPFQEFFTSSISGVLYEFQKLQQFNSIIISQSAPRALPSLFHFSHWNTFKKKEGGFQKQTKYPNFTYGTLFLVFVFLSLHH